MRALPAARGRSRTLECARARRSPAPCAWLAIGHASRGDDVRCSTCRRRSVGRDLLSVADLSAAEVERVFATAAALKAEYRATRRHAEPPLVGRTLAMLFQKPSLRTRVTFEAGMAQLGGHAIYLTNDVVLGARESVRDVARNLERFVDGIVVRTGPARGRRRSSPPRPASRSSTA